MIRSLAAVKHAHSITCDVGADHVHVQLLVQSGDESGVLLRKSCLKILASELSLPGTEYMMQQQRGPNIPEPPKKRSERLMSQYAISTCSALLFLTIGCTCQVCSCWNALPRPCPCRRVSRPQPAPGTPSCRSSRSSTPSSRPRYGSSPRRSIDTGICFSNLLRMLLCEA
jgi:hypothetical protein